MLKSQTPSTSDDSAAVSHSLMGKSTYIEPQQEKGPLLRDHLRRPRPEKKDSLMDESSESPSGYHVY